MMSNKDSKKITLGIMLGAVCLLSIGFAAFTASLNINTTATYTPDESAFKVVFSGSSDEVTTDVQKAEVGATATDAVINGTTLSNLNANFTEPGQRVEYYAYALNESPYMAYLNSIQFIGNKVCSSTGDATPALVQAACDSIKIYMVLENANLSYMADVTESISNIQGATLDKKGSGDYLSMVIVIEYEEGGTNVDGPLNVTFPDIGFVFATNEEDVDLDTPATGTICSLDQDSNVVGTIDAGDQYTCDVAPNETQTFYVLNTDTENNKVNLIMDSNINISGEAVKEGEVTDYGFVAYASADVNELGDASSGPVTAMTYLNTATSNWGNITSLNETYDDEAGLYTGFALTGKARMIKASEAREVCNGGCPAWMIGNLVERDYEATEAGIPGGYWTLDTDANGAGSDFGAKAVDYAGTVDYLVARDADVVVDTWFGVRPVITLEISQLGE